MHNGISVHSQTELIHHRYQIKRCMSRDSGVHATPEVQRYARDYSEYHDPRLRGSELIIPNLCPATALVVLSAGGNGQPAVTGNVIRAPFPDDNVPVRRKRVRRGTRQLCQQRHSAAIVSRSRESPIFKARGVAMPRVRGSVTL